MPRTYCVFTKPWKTLSVPDLCAVVRRMGFDAIEFPLRPGFLVEPENAEKGLPALANQLAEHGVRMVNITCDTMTEAVFAGCAAANVALVRVGGHNRDRINYLEWEQQYADSLNALVPLCQQYQVKLGVQNHFGNMVSSTMEMRHLFEKCEPRYIGGIWDVGHSGLAGEEAEQAIDIVWDYLFMVNFKNAYWKMQHGCEVPAQARYYPYFTTGQLGVGDFVRACAHLNKRGYTGPVCIPAEYDADVAYLEGLTMQDFAYVKSMLQE